MITGNKILESDSLWARLTGSWFHQLDDKGEVEYQGHVLEVADDDRLTVQFYDWLCGAPGDEATLCRLELDTFIFYGSDYEMRKNYGQLENKKILMMRQKDDASNNRIGGEAGPPTVRPGPDDPVSQNDPIPRTEPEGPAAA